MKYSTDCDFGMGREREDAPYMLSLNKSYVHIEHGVKGEEQKVKKSDEKTALHRFNNIA